MSTSKQNVVKKTSKTTTKRDEREPSRERSKKKREDSTAKDGKSSLRVSKSIGDVAKPKIVSSRSVVGGKKVVPNSPTSSRVVKSQFFPNKQMYSNALTADEKVKIKAQLQPRKVVKGEEVFQATKVVRGEEVLQLKKVVKGKEEVIHSRKVTRGEEVLQLRKVVKSEELLQTPMKGGEISSGNSSMTNSLERPGTATLRKGSIVNKNIAGPDMPKDLKVKKKVKSKTEQFVDEKRKLVKEESGKVKSKTQNVAGEDKIRNVEKVKSKTDEKRKVISEQSKKLKSVEKVADEKKAKEGMEQSKKGVEKVKLKIDKVEKRIVLNGQVEEVGVQNVKNVSIIEDEVVEELRLHNKSTIDKVVSEQRKVSIHQLDELGLQNIKPETGNDQSDNVAKVKPNVRNPHENAQIKIEDDYDYEEDFESYASDFEEYKSESENSTTTVDYSIRTNEGITSSSSSEDLYPPKTEPNQKRVNSADEEHKLDSGNFDLPETKHKPILGNITENTMASLSDEGFEEAKSLQFVNFLEAKKKRQRERSLQKKNKRGEELMGMIRLDQRNFTLFNMPPVSYDDYIKSFGNRNSVQVASQTGDDDVTEETQTDPTETETKWTQFPTKITKPEETDPNYLNTYKREILGVGSDVLKPQVVEIKYNEYNLNAFLQSSSQVILTLLQEANRSAPKEIEISDRKLPFSDGQITFDTGFLKNRCVSHISFTITGGVKMLSVHEPKKVDQSDELDLKSVGCVWNVGNTNEPEDVFSGFGIIECTCFSADNNKLILGGMYDGTVTLWDLLESPRTHNYLDIDSKNHILVKSSSYTTSADVDHCSRIVSISSNYHSDNDAGGNPGYNWIATVQVLTLDETGNLTIWGLISKPSLENTRNANFNHKYLVRNSVVSLPATNPELHDLQCTEMCVNRGDPNHVFVSTNYGYTLHCLVSGTKANPKRYSPGSLCKANTIDTCVHSNEYFLVGYDNGNVSLFSKSVKRPLMTVCNQESDEADVEVVQWSQNRPCLFYTKDKNSTIDVWDLSFSELLPAFSVPFKDGVKSIKLSPVEANVTSNARSYMAIVTNDDQIFLHVLNKEHGRQPTEEFQAELKKFSNYVNRL